MGARFRQRVLFPVAMLLLPVCLGCSGRTAEANRFTMSGTVRFNGEPIEDGEIAFLPQPGSQGTSTSSIIRNGQYEVGGRFGIMPGEYKVSVKSFRQPATAAKTADGIERPVNSAFDTREQLLPEKFNSASTIEPLLVPDQPGEFIQDFDLQD